jgi:hypothetical protein
MAHSDEPAAPKAVSSLLDRAARYKQEVDKVVREVGEHPLFELKRSCAMSVLKDRIEFVKDIQSIATSRIESEKFLVIGADAASKSFVPVTNLTDFDEAKLRQLLEKYLNPVPEFEVFQLSSSAGHPFLLVVIPRQKRRRILARATVEDSSDPRPKILLREGDLWTKGASTGKRLAKPEDWDEIYEEAVESEAERRTRQRTAHALDLAIAREKVRPTGGGASALPSYFNDDEFQAVVEDLCSTKDESKFKVLLERLRDELVEGWHLVGGYEEASFSPSNTVPLPKEKIQEHIRNVFRPNMHWLTLAGMYVVKNSGPCSFLEAVVSLLKEIFETSQKLLRLRMLTPYGVSVTNANEHTSYTVPALESLTSLHLIGAYVAKRGRFEYFRSLLGPDVHRTSLQETSEELRLPMAFWPLGMNQGEPSELKSRAGRIDFCVSRVKADSVFLKLFGSLSATTAALCQYEFCLELNSYMTVPGEGTAESATYVEKVYPGFAFYFWPSLIAFPLEHIFGLAVALFEEIRRSKPHLLKKILFDDSLAIFLTKPGGDVAFLACLRSLASDQGGLYIEQRRFAPMLIWPKEIASALKESQNKRAPGPATK